MIKIRVNSTGNVVIEEIVEDGGWMIVCKETPSFDIYSIPLYGGEPVFEEKVNSILEAVKIVQEYS